MPGLWDAAAGLSPPHLHRNARDQVGIFKRTKNTQLGLYAPYYNVFLEISKEEPGREF
jgi:hypothetical protein